MILYSLRAHAAGRPLDPNSQLAVLCGQRPQPNSLRVQQLWEKQQTSQFDFSITKKKKKKWGRNSIDEKSSSHLLLSDLW